MNAVKFAAAAFGAALMAAGAAGAGDIQWKPPGEIAPKAEAQTQSAPAAAQPAAPAAAPAKTAEPKKAEPLSPEAKKAKAKECSDQADAKGLHGKARKKFRDDCKKS
jgi:hypothetical protein